MPASGAPLELLECFDPEKSRITRKSLGRETLILFGGLDGTLRYYGVGLTPEGREKEAAIGQMLASRLRPARDGTPDGPAKPPAEEEWSSWSW